MDVEEVGIIVLKIVNFMVVRVFMLIMKVGEGLVKSSLME